MPGVYASGADHCTLSAQLAGLQHPQSLVRIAVVKFLHRGAQTGRHKMSRRADSRTAPAGHTLANVRLKRGKRLELLPVEQVKIDSGTWNQTETEIYHLSRTKVL